MKRREFLTLSLMGLGVLLLPSGVQAMTTPTSLKASAGQILGLSVDGIHWKVLANLGSQYNVLGIYQNQDTYFAKVSFQGHIFFLKSTDSMTWYTSDWTPPSTWQVQTSEANHG